MERDYLQELTEILKSNLSKEEKKEKIMQYHENDIAEALESLDDNLRDELFSIIGTEASAEVLTYVDDVEALVDDMTNEEAADLIEAMDADDAIDVLSELDDDQRKEIVSLMDKEAVADIHNIIQYDEDEIGSKMTNNYICVNAKNTIKEAMKKVIKDAADNDNVSIIYVLDDDEKLIGAFDLRDLIVARDTDDISKIMKTNYPSFKATTNVSECLEKLKDYALDSYPIVSDSGKMLGVVTSDDVVEVIDDELSDDYAKLAGLTESQNSDDSFFKSIRKRLPWLLILLVLGLLESFLMTNFEHVVEKLVIIVFFQAMVLSMCGNSGTQSLAVTIRLISTEELDKKNLVKNIFKEIKIGFINGLILGSLAFVTVFLYMLISRKGAYTNGQFNPVDAVMSGLIVASALICAMTASSCVGTIMPIMFKKMKIDPAVASGPFITTVNDIIALLIYYGLAWLIFLI